MWSDKKGKSVLSATAEDFFCVRRQGVNLCLVSSLHITYGGGVIITPLLLQRTESLFRTGLQLSDICLHTSRNDDHSTMRLQGS